MNTKKEVETLERAYQEVTDVTWGYVLHEMESMNARIVYIGIDHLGWLFLSPEEIDEEESGWTIYGLINLDEVDPDEYDQFEKLKSNMLKELKIMLDRAREEV